MIVDVTNSSSTQTQVFNPPFVDGQLYDFNIGGNVADGSPVTVTVYFSDDISCTLTSSGLNSPQNCDCAADIGTFSTATHV